MKLILGRYLSTFEGNEINLENIDWSKIDWASIDWGSIDFNELDLDFSNVFSDILGEGPSNFLSWVKDSTVDWIEDSGYC